MIGFITLFIAIVYFFTLPLIALYIRAHIEVARDAKELTITACQVFAFIFLYSGFIMAFINFLGGC